MLSKRSSEPSIWTEATTVACNSCKKEILDKFISVDSIAYTEVNFKSKLIEWTQKNKISISFELLEQGSEQNGTPTFSSQVFLQNIQCGCGKGYSKKESQQIAAKETLEMLKKTGFAHKILNERELTAKVATTKTGQQDTAAQEQTIDTKEENKNQSKEEIIEAAEKAAFEKQTD